MTRTDLAYRRTAAEGASGFGLLIALFDTLAGDLRRAAEAQRRNDIEQRSSEVRHALLVIGHLEGWVACGTGGELAHKLVSFYSQLRCRLLEAQAKQSPEIFDQEMANVLTVREHWQRMDANAVPPGLETAFPQAPPYPGFQSMQGERSRSSWSV